MTINGRVLPLPHLDQADDDYEFVVWSLDRWHDRAFAKMFRDDEAEYALAERQSRIEFA